MRPQVLDSAISRLARTPETLRVWLEESPDD